MKHVSAKKGKTEEIASVGAIRIVQRALNSDCSASELADLASADPAFAIRLLAVVNSATFGLSVKVKDVHRAAAMLGVRRLRSIALGLVVASMAPNSETGSALLAGSVRRAVAAMAVAEAMGNDDVESCFTVGLFLEVGLLSTAMHDEELAKKIVSSPATERVLRERELGLTPHAERGAELTQSFELPDELVHAIRDHHDPLPPEAPTARAAWLAERMAAVYEGGALGRTRQVAMDGAMAIGMDAETANEILKSLPERVRGMADTFDRDLGEQVDFDALVHDANRSLVEMNGQYEDLIHRLEEMIAENERIASELVVANEQLAMYASTDALTGLPNKRAFTEAINRDLSQLDRKADGVLSLIVIDVDHFKRFNDTWGHAIGDEVLRVVGEVLSDQVRGGDMAARYGGEEFVVVMPNTGSPGAKVAAERIRQALEAAKIEGPKGKLSVTASFGVASVKGPGCRHAAAELFKRADAALYDAKHAGRNRVAMAA